MVKRKNTSHNNNYCVMYSFFYSIIEWFFFFFFFNAHTKQQNVKPKNFYLKENNISCNSKCHALTVRIYCNKLINNKLLK
jgi:hypothetical protein